MALAKRRQKRKTKFNLRILICDAKLRFALFVTLRLAILSEIKADNLLVTFLKRVNNNFRWI